ncbi:hypothetical protein POTOM_056902 [Populus tomentosa]|uniref:Uncharacterized protein n=1 Tax=Populus tomentosa TaxID=118781 RepID=A0A8X8C182_POPTO|nr:hypothetical protein POTOM_056902 [Populus tomentosa]
MGLQLVSTVGNLDEGIAGHGGCCSCFSKQAWVAMVDAAAASVCLGGHGGCCSCFSMLGWPCVTGGCVKSDVVGVFDRRCSCRILKHQCMILEYTEQCGV